MRVHISRCQQSMPVAPTFALAHETPQFACLLGPGRGSPASLRLMWWWHTPSSHNEDLADQDSRTRWHCMAWWQSRRRRVVRGSGCSATDFFALDQPYPRVKCRKSGAQRQEVVVVTLPVSETAAPFGKRAEKLYNVAGEPRRAEVSRYVCTFSRVLLKAQRPPTNATNSRHQLSQRKLELFLLTTV